ncbi:hypothetical protein [Carboxylicivirga marina]|uniref:hypothetical protein n=1 Tax=Carboxylicivirga marina TaxID=2800988 RepID=UPI002593091B|nr:hypothetical protein [uncultured Carboxylicivirga sp.]
MKTENYQKSLLLFRSIFIELYNKSFEDNYYWQYCSLKTYKSTFERRQNEFLKQNLDAINTDFLQSEKSKTKYSILNIELYEHQITEKINSVEPTTNNSAVFFKVDLDNYIPPSLMEKVELSQKRKIEFIQTKLDQLKRSNNESYSQHLNHKKEQLDCITSDKNIQSKKDTDGQKPYLNLRLQQFLDCITDKEIEYTIKVDGGDDWGGNDIIGTIKDFQRAVKNDPKLKDFILPILKGKKEYAIDYELGDIEIYNYLEKITKSFDILKTKIVLDEVECYYTTDFKDRLIEESKRIHEENNWKTPTNELPKHLQFNVKDTHVTHINDYEAMLDKTHKHRTEAFRINSVINLLEKKIAKSEKHDLPINSNSDFAQFTHILTPKGYEKFRKCFNKYQDELTIQSITNWCSIYYAMFDLKLLSNSSNLTNYLKELPDLTNNTEMFFPKGKTRKEITEKTLTKWLNRLNKME